jgi:hypothetical protein
LHAQENNNLFTYTDAERNSLSATAEELLNNIESKKQVKSVRLIEIIELQSQFTSESISVNLPNGTTFNFLNTSTKEMKEKYHYWRGYDSENKASFSMVISENELTGMIRANGYMFDINSLRDTQYHILKEMNTSELENESAPIKVEGTVEEKDTNKQKSITPTINVLVAYTTDAKNNHSGNIESSIILAEGNMDNAFSNSDINADVDVVHTMEVNYSESSDSFLNLCRLTTSTIFTPSECNSYSNLNGYIDLIHEKRYDYDAQVVVLITGSGGAGIAWLRSNSDYAFSIAREDRFVSTYTMAHEIGHNIGAQHNKSQDNNPFYSYGHGYNYNPSNWSTIMAYPPSGSSRINHFSNPDETFAGVATGTATDEDNARVWDNRSGIVANFDPPVYAPPIDQVTISGPTSLNEFQPGTWSTSVTGGTSPFSHVWYKRPVIGTGNWVQVGTSQNYSTSDNESFQLRVSVTDDFDLQGSDDITVSVSSAGGGCVICKQVALPTDFVIKNNFPNPFNPSTQIKFELPETAEVSLNVYNIMGQEVATIANGQMQAGFHNATFEASNLASGVYIARLSAIGSSGQQFIREIKMQLIK